MQDQISKSVTELLTNFPLKTSASVKNFKQSARSISSPVSTSSVSVKLSSPSFSASSLLKNEVNYKIPFGHLSKLTVRAY